MLDKTVWVRRAAIPPPPPQSARSRDSPGRACRSQASYKYPLKKYIFDFDGDAEYYAGKTKVKSAHNVWGYQLGLTDSLHTIHFGRLSASRERFVARYGRTLHARFVEGERSVLDE